MCISFYCDVVFTHLYLISWWVPPLYFPFQVDSRPRTKSRKQNHLEGHNASLPRRPSSWPEVMAKHNQTCFKPMLTCEPLYHVKACSSTSECLQLRRSKWPDVRKTTTKQTRRTFTGKNIISERTLALFLHTSLVKINRKGAQMSWGPRADHHAHSPAKWQASNSGTVQCSQIYTQESSRERGQFPV